MTKPSDNTGESASAKIIIIIIKRREMGRGTIIRFARDSRLEISRFRATCQLFINPAFHSLLNLYSRLLPLVLLTHIPTQPRRLSCYLVLCFLTCKNSMAQATSNSPSGAAGDRPERSRNAKAQARHRAKRKAYIEQVMLLPHIAWHAFVDFVVPWKRIA